MNDFQIRLIAGLDSSKSKQQLSSDINTLKKQLSTVDVQAKLGKDVVTNLSKQLNMVQINLQNVKIDQNAINNMISQINKSLSSININLGSNINTSGAIQSAQKTGQQIGQQLGNSINQSLQANLGYVKQNIQNLLKSFSAQKLNSADIFKTFNLNRAKIDPSVTKEVQSLTTELNALANQALKTNSDSSWEGIVNKINILSNTLTKFGSTRDISGFKEQLDILNYFQGKKIFVGDKSEALQNAGMSIRELNTQFRNLGVTFTSVSENSTKLDQIWSELFNINPSLQNFTTFGDQINAIVNELKVAKEALYGDSNLRPVDSGEVVKYLNSWQESLSQLSSKIETLKTEQLDLESQIAQASNSTTNTIVDNQQKQRQAYQQTAQAVQAITSDQSVIKSGVGARAFDNVDQAKQYFTDLMQSEKAVIATTERFGENNGLTAFAVNIKRATGEVESLRYVIDSIKDDSGNVLSTFYRPSSSQLNDAGAIKQIEAIERAFSDYETRLAKFKSTNSEILSGLDTPLKDFESKLSGLKNGVSTINEVKTSFNALNSEAAKITQNFSKQLSPIDRAVSKIAQGDEAIKSLRADFKGLDNAPKEINKELNTCATLLQKVKSIESQEGRTENWSKAYKDWASAIDTVSAKLNTLKKEQSNVASTQIFNTRDLKANNVAYMSKVYNTIEKQMVEINRLANVKGWSDVKVSGVEEASGKIQKLTLTVRDAEGALKSFNMQREKIQGNGKAQAGLIQTGDIKVLETAVQYAEKLKSIEASMGEFGNTTTAIATLENGFTKLGLSTDEVRSKMNAVKTEYSTLQSMIENGASSNEIVLQFEKVNSVLGQTQNDLKTTRSEYSILATEFSRLSLANDIEEWNQKNSAATKEVIAQNEKYIVSLRDLDTAMTKVEQNNIANSFKETENSMRGLGKLGASITDQFKQAIDSFKVWVSATTLVMGAVTKVRDAVTEIKDINDILTEISKTSDITQAKLSELGKSAYDHASKYGLKASNWLTGVQEMNRSGFYGEQGTALADTSTLAQSAGDMTAEVANNWILATNAAYKYEGEAEKLNAVLDGTNEITNRNSVNMTDMADAMTIVGSNAANTGVKVDELSSIIGTAVATTKKSGSEVGTAFKTIFVNLQNTSSDKILNTLKEAGTSMTEIKDGAERLRSPIAILKDLAKTYNSLDKDDPLRADITRNIGGKHYANVLGSTLDNFEQYSKMLQDYSEGNGSAMEEAQKSAHNLTGELNTLGNTWTSTVNNIINADDLTKVVRNLNSLLSAVDEITGVLGTTGTIGVGAGLIANAKNVGLFNMIKDNDSLSGQKLVTSLEARKVAQEEVVRQLEVDIQCLKAYETECQKGEVSTETFASTMKGASVEAQKYAVNIKEGTGSAETFATNQKAIQTSMTETATVSKVAAAGLSIFKAALNTIIIFAAVEGIQLLINAFDNLVLTVDEAEEARSKAASDLSEAQSNLESINSELETTQQRIDELNGKDKLTFTEQGELEDLKEKNKLLQLQADAAERIQKSKQQDLLNTDSDNFNKLYKDKINKSDIAETKQEYKNSVGALNPKENDITGQIAQLQLLQDQYADLATQVENYNDQYGKEHGAEYLADDMKVTQGSIDDVTSSLNKQLETLLNMQNDYQSVGIDNLTSNQKEEYEQIANAIKLIYSSLDPSKYNEISVQDIFDTKDIEVTKDDLIALAQAGDLDENTLEKYPKLTKAIKDADLIIGGEAKSDTETFTDAIVAMSNSADEASDSVDDVADSTSSFSSSVSSLKDLKDQLSDLDTIMASFVSGDDIDVSSFDNIINKFTELKEAGKDIDMSSVEDAINQIGNSSSIEEAQSSLDSLCQQYINASGILDNLTESNAGFVQSQLEQIGVSNAAEIVTNSLAAEQDYLAWAKDNSAASSANLANMTSVEMAALLADANVTDEAKASMYNYWVAKGNVLDLGAITTDGDISNLSGLCSALGIATKQCETFAKAKSLLAAAVQSNDLTAIAGYAGQIAGLQASITTQISATLGSKSNSNYSPKYGGGSATKSAQEKADKANNSNKDKGSGSSDEPQEQDYDWIETLLSRIQRQVTNLGKTVSATYKKWSTRNNALTQELSAVNSEIDVQYKAYQKYIDLANSVGLSEDYASLVRNGSLDVSTIADDDLNEQISQYKQYYEAALDCADTIQDLNDKVAELAKSKFDNISSEYESQLKQIEHSTNIYQSYIDQVEAEDKIPLRSYYEQLIKNENSNINKLKEEYFVLTKAMNEAIAAGKIEKYSEDWYSMQEAVDSVSESIQDANKSLIEYTKSMKELAKTRFDKIATSFDNPGDLIDHSQTYYNNFIDEAEAEGHLASKDYYKALINLENLNLSNLVKESDELNKSLNEALKSGDVEKYSDTWYDMVGKINDVDEAIQDANKSLIEYGNNMRQIEWDLFDKTEDYISKLQDESDFIIDLLSNNELYDENTGNDTKYATALKGLHAVNYNVYMAQADEYAKEIKKLNSEIAKDPSNSTLLERRQELLKAQQDAISGAEDEKQSIKDLVSNGYDKMLDALQKLIDKRKEVLDAEKSLYDYEKSISEKTENLANLRKQWSALQGDNSEEAKTKRQQLETSIKDVESDLQDTEYQQYISDQEKLFDNFYDQTETWLNERLDNLDGIINDVIESTNANAYDISQTISEATSDVGYTLSDEMSRIWDHDDIDSINRTTSGIGSVVSIYGDDFSNRLTTTNTTIDGIKTLVQSLVDDSAKRKAAEDAAEEAAKATQASAQQAKQTSTSTTPSTSTTTKTTTSTTSNKSSSSNSNNSNNSSSGWGSWFVHKTDSFPKSKLDISNSIVDRLKYRDIDSAFNKRKDYYYAMGGTGTYKGSASQNTWMISQMKAHGFKKGGTIGSAIKQTGEDGYILARTGEEVLSLEKLEMLKEALKYTSNISYPNVSSPTIPNFANASQSINSNLDVGGVNIVMNGVNDMQAFSKQMRTALADDVKTQKMIKSMLWNNGMDYKKFK